MHIEQHNGFWFVPSPKIKSNPLWQNWIWTANEGTCKITLVAIWQLSALFHCQGCCLENERFNLKSASEKEERVCLPKSVIAENWLWKKETRLLNSESRESKLWKELALKGRRRRISDEKFHPSKKVGHMTMIQQRRRSSPRSNTKL